MMSGLQEQKVLLIEKLDQMYELQTELNFQILSAKTAAKKRVFADVDWFHRVRTKRRRHGIEINRLKAEIGEINKKIKEENNSQSKNRLSRFLSQRIGPNWADEFRDWQKINK